MMFLLRAAIRSWILISIAVSSLLASHAQTQESSSASYVFDNSAVILKKDVPEVNLVLTVTDRHSHFVRDLMPADFSIRDNGQLPTKITHFESQTNLPLQVALVIDTSDSVSYCFGSEKYAAKLFLRGALRSASDVALVMSFNAKTNVVQGATADPRLLSHAISRLRPGGETAIYDAVAAASKELGKLESTQSSRRAIILITDGNDNSSKVSLRDATQIAQENEDLVYVLDTGGQYFGSAEAQSKMLELAQLTGGRFFKADNEDRLRDAFGKVESELRSQYAISYQPANTKSDGMFHQIVVVVPNKLVVRHRQGYFAR